MSELQPLYNNILDDTELMPATGTPKPVKQDGTFSEKLSQYVQPYRTKHVDKAISKGSVLHKLMLSNSQTAGQMMIQPLETAESDFQDVDDLQRFGYEEDTTLRDLHNTTLIDISKTLANIGLGPSFKQKPGSPLPSEANVPIGHKVFMENVTEGTDD
jgi:hypothetical protein